MSISAPLYTVGQRVVRIQSDREVNGAVVLSIQLSTDPNEHHAYYLQYDEGPQEGQTMFGYFKHNGVGWWPENCLIPEIV